MTVTSRARSCRFVALAVLVLAVALVPASAASAHAELLTSEPAESAVVATAPAAIRLTFSEAVETALGGIRVFDARGAAVVVGQPRHGSGRADQVEATTNGLGDGSYVVAWRVTSSDSHPVQGSFVFSVGRRSALSAEAGGALGRTTGSRTVGVVLGVARLVVFAGFGVLAGGLASVALFGRAARRTTVVLVAGALALVVGSLASIGLQGGYATGASLARTLRPAVWRDTAHTEFGRQALLRVGLGALGAALALVVARAGRAWWRAAALVLGPLGALTLAFAGHAHTGRWPAVGVSADVVHLVALAWWLGGLALLAATALRAPDGRDAVRRFSPFALGCVAAAVASGALQSWRQVGSRDGLATPYGRLLLAKLAVVVVLVLAAWASRRALSRWTADLRTPTLLRRALLGELALGLGVLGVTAGLVASAPGRDQVAKPFTVSLVSAKGARADLTIEPAKAGAVTVHLYVTPPGGALASAADAQLTLSLPGRGVSDLDLPLEPAGRNHFASVGARIPFAGRWQANVSVRVGDFDSYAFATAVNVR